MIELRIYRYGVELYRSSELIELDIDGIRYSGVEYYSQEAREMSLSLLYTEALQNILEGSGRMILAGWHALVIRLFQDGVMIWQGLIKDGGFCLTWLGAGEKLCDLKSIYILGNRLRFDGYEMLPTELSRNHISGELEIRGRRRRVG